MAGKIYDGEARLSGGGLYETLKSNIYTTAMPGTSSQNR